MWIYHLDPIALDERVLAHYLQTGPESFSYLEPHEAPWLSSILRDRGFMYGLRSRLLRPPPPVAHITTWRFNRGCLIREYGWAAACVTHRSPGELALARAMFDGRIMFGPWARAQHPMAWVNHRPTL